MRQLIRTYGSKKRLSSFLKNSIQSVAPSAIDKVKIWRQQIQSDTIIENSQDLSSKNKNLSVSSSSWHGILSQGLPSRLSFISNPASDHKIILCDEPIAERQDLAVELPHDRPTSDTFSSQSSLPAMKVLASKSGECSEHESNATMKRRIHSSKSTCKKIKVNKKQRVQKDENSTLKVAPPSKAKDLKQSLRPTYPSLHLCSLQHVNSWKKI